MGIVFQSFHLVPTMTAIENVALPMELAGDGPRGKEGCADSWTEVGLAARVDHFPAELSGGEQQRVAIARAPSAVRLRSFSPTSRRAISTGARGKQIIDLLFGLRERRNATLMIVTHDNELAAMADRVIRMADGAIVV